MQTTFLIKTVFEYYKECSTDRDCAKQNLETPYCSERCLKLEDGTNQNPKCESDRKYTSNYCKSNVSYCITRFLFKKVIKDLS